MSLTRLEMLTSIRDMVAALIALEAASADPPVVPSPPPPPPPGLTAAQKAVALAESGAPKVSVGSIEIPLAAPFAYVPVSLDKPPICTVYVDVSTRNGTGAIYAYEGGQFARVTQQLCWKPGDPLTQWVSIPTKNGGEGKAFALYIPTTPQGAARGVDSGTITFRSAALPQPIPPAYGATPLRAPVKGELVYEFKAAAFKAADAGGPGVFRSRFSHGRTQDGNNEQGYYTDPVLHPGARPFEIRGDELVLRAEKFAAPMAVTVGGVARSYNYGAAVLQANFLSQIYGYYEWDVMLPSARGTWEGLWLLSSDGSWPPEIDVSESPRNGAIGPGDTTATIHWGTQATHKAIGLTLNGRKIFNDPALDFTTGFHTRAVDWREDWTTMFIDGREVARFPTTFHKPAFPLMDVAVGGWGGAPDFSAGTTEMRVRAFRVFK